MSRAGACLGRTSTNRNGADTSQQSKQTHRRVARWGNKVRLYSYSNKLHTFVEAKWVMTKFAIGGILMGVILLGVMRLNQSVANALGSRSAETLAAENQILRSQLVLISPRVNELELQAKQLDERVNKLHALLDGRKIVRDTAWRFTNVIKVTQLKPAIPVRASFRP
jgi:hypothetical protein